MLLPEGEEGRVDLGVRVPVEARRRVLVDGARADVLPLALLEDGERVVEARLLAVRELPLPQLRERAWRTVAPVVRPLSSGGMSSRRPSVRLARRLRAPPPFGT